LLKQSFKHLYLKFVTYAAFPHAGLTTRYRKKYLYKSIFVLSRSRDILEEDTNPA